MNSLHTEIPRRLPREGPIPDCPSMHEMSVAMNIIDVATSSALAEEAATIDEIEIEVGELSGIMIESLEFCLDAAIRQTMADGAKVSITRVKGRGICEHCRAEVRLDSLHTPCPQCGEYGIRITGGSDIRLLSLVVDKHKDGRRTADV